MIVMNSITLTLGNTFAAIRPTENTNEPWALSTTKIHNHDAKGYISIVSPEV
jgi:hypothetical protein